jgi:hypothetical protein
VSEDDVYRGNVDDRSGVLGWWRRPTYCDWCPCSKSETMQDPEHAPCGRDERAEIVPESVRLIRGGALTRLQEVLVKEPRLTEFLRVPSVTCAPTMLRYRRGTAVGQRPTGRVLVFLKLISIRQHCSLHGPTVLSITTKMSSPITEVAPACDWLMRRQPLGRRHVRAR